MSADELDSMRYAEEVEQYVIGIQQDLHIHPEVSGEEKRTIEKITSELEGMGLDCEVIPNGGIISIIEGGSPGRALVLRADIDALPMKEDASNLRTQKKVVSNYDDAAHTCGHDGHTAMLLGAAKILVRQKEKLKGRIILAFEQGEEDGRGIVGILRRILEIGADGVWGIHLKADMPSGKISVDPGPRMAGAFMFDVKIIGNGGHGARPDLASTPLDVFTDFYNSLKSMRMNSLDPFKAITFSIGSVNAGSNHNVIPDSLNFKGTFRYLHHDQGKKAELEFRERLDKISALHNCTYEYIQEPNAVDLSVYNNETCAEIAREAVEKSLGKEALYNYPAWMASEPFAFYQKYLPGVFAFIGIENAEKGTGAGHHHPKFEIDDDVLKLGVAVTVQYTLDFLASDEDIIFEPEEKPLESLAKEAGIRVFPRERGKIMEIHGRNGSAKAFIETIEENTIEQIKKMLDSDITKNAKVRIMPDVHYGKGSTIGTTIRLSESENDWKVSPNVVGVDIGCGMMSYKLADFNVPLDEFDKLVGSKVPSGKGVHAAPNSDPDEWTKNLTMPLSDKEKDYISRSLGTLGGGNHFIELAVDENGDHWLTVHSGSRKLGHMIATYHQKVADFTRNNPENEELLQSLKEKGHYEEIHKLLNPGKKKRKRVDDLAYLEGDLLADYINDMSIAQQFAHENRKAMLDAMIEAAGLEHVDAFDSIHNFIDIENGIIRKGATSAREGERLIIPLNMRDGSLICAGKGNPDWNYSAPHGAGRVMSRTQASKTIDVKAFMDSMEGVYSSSVGQKTVDESPFVYKAAEDIISRIGDTVEIQHWIKPVYNFKAK